MTLSGKVVVVTGGGNGIGRAVVIERVIDVNLSGALNLVKATLPHLPERPVAHIANVASMGAFLPVPGQSVCRQGAQSTAWSTSDGNRWHPSATRNPDR